MISDLVLKINSFFNARRVRFYGTALALITVLLGVAVYIHVPRFAISPGADFVQFYAASILGRDDPGNIYDRAVQQEIQRRFSPGAEKGTYWPYLHAPFFTLILLPLSSLSYAEAFWVWTGSTALLYLGSVVLISRKAHAPLGLSLALASGAPVFYWLMITGQTTAMALFLWAIGFALMKRRQLFAAMLVLGLLSYRAQYLAVIVPLLIVRRAWLGLVGIVASIVILLLLGGFVFSFSSYSQYLNAALMQSQRMVTQDQPLIHYITLYGFFRPLLPNDAAIACTIIAALPLAYWLFKVWQLDQTSEIDLQWSLAICSTLLLMHHGFVYDLLLLTVPVLLLYPYRNVLPAYYKLVLITLYFVPYIFLLAGDVMPINPIQPILYWLCFEFYQTAKKVACCGGTSIEA